MRHRFRRWALVGGGVLLLALITVIRLNKSPTGSPAAAQSRVRQHLKLDPPAHPQPSADKRTDTPPSLAGRVIDDQTGGIAPGVVIHAYSAAGKGMPPIFSAETTSDSNGGYSFWLPPGEFIFRWFYEPHEEDVLVIALGSEVLRLPESGGTLNHDFHCSLFPIVVIDGSVVDNGSSLPIENAKLFLGIDGADSAQNRRDDPKKFEQSRPFLASKDCYSLADGRFRIVSMLHPGQYWVFASQDKYESYFGNLEKNGIKVIQGAPLQRFAVLVRMRTEIQATLKGKVLSREGHPISQAQVIVANGSFVEDVLTRPDGTFSARVTPESVTVTIRHSQYRTLRYELGSINPDSVPDLEKEDAPRVLDLKEFGVDVNVVDDSGRPVPMQSLVIGEDDPKGRGNPTFPVMLSGQGTGSFRADSGLGYYFILPDGSPWRIVGRSSSDAVRTKGTASLFSQPQNTVTITVQKR